MRIADHRAALGGLAAIVVILAAYGVVDRNDRAAEQRVELARWLRDHCMPSHKDDRAVVRYDAEGRLRCSIFSGVSYAKAAPEVATASIEVPR